MKPSLKLAAAVVFLFLLGTWGIVSWPRHSERDEAEPTEITGESVSEEMEPATVKVDPEADQTADFRFERLADGRSLVNEAVKISQTLHVTDVSPDEDLQAVDSIFGLYRWAYKENPEGGDNREIVDALTGNNPRKLVFIPKDHPSINSSGELLDRWGTPYFFHKLTDQVIDVSSAGPDKRQWSNDDLTLGYTESYQASSSQ